AGQAGHPPRGGLAGGASERRRRLGRGHAVLGRAVAGGARRLHRVAARVGAAGAARGRGCRAGRGGRGAVARRAPAKRRDLGRAPVHRDRLPARLLPELPPVPSRVPGQRARPVPGGYAMRHPPPASDSSPDRPQVPGRTPLRGTPSAEDQPPTLPGCVPPARPCEAPAREADELSGPAGTLLVRSPLRLEARAVRRGLPGPARGSVRVTGYGPARSRRQAQDLAGADFGALAIAGLGGGLTADLAPGDLVVGTEVSDGRHTTRCAAA